MRAEPGAPLNVMAFMTPEMIADVRAGRLEIDCAPAFQAAIDAASGRGQSTLMAGRRLVIPGGRYLIAQPLRFVWRGRSAHERARADTALEALQGALEAYASTSLSFQVFALRLREAFGLEA